jgi:hypothetical protein
VFFSKILIMGGMALLMYVLPKIQGKLTEEERVKTD